MIRRHLRSTLFPYTTLFRSVNVRRDVQDVRDLERPTSMSHARRNLQAGRPGVTHQELHQLTLGRRVLAGVVERDRKSTRLNSSHVATSYAVYSMKKKRENRR